MPARKKIGILASFTNEVFKGEYFARLIAGTVGAARPTEYDLQFLLVRDKEPLDRRILGETKPDGLIFLTWTIHGRYLLEAKAAGIPAVVINDFTPGLDLNIVVMLPFKQGQN